MKGNVAVVLIPGAGMSTWTWRDIVDLISLPTICIGDRLTQNTFASRKSSSLGDQADQRSRDQADDQGGLDSHGEAGAGIASSPGPISC